MSQKPGTFDPHDLYQSPLVARNASERMSRLFGAHHRIRTWRRIWLELARTQKELGLPITEEQIRELERTLENIDFAKAAEFEARLRHDVMAHLHAWSAAAPAARPILHWGATSAEIVDNADLILMREALEIVRDGLAGVVLRLADFAQRHHDLPTLGYTHFQPAQLTTVGKRASLWCYDFLRDLEEVEERRERLRFRGVKGATGTQASFLTLFDGDETKVAELERRVAHAFGFDGVEPVTGQTYSRKVDAQIAAALAGIAASVHKFSNDIRLLAGLGEMEEPFEEAQVGSSAMAYKRNPMRCERATGLARLVISFAQSLFQTAAEQWLERSLDDSSNRRVTLPEAFLATDGMLRIIANVAEGLVVHSDVIDRRIRAELPFMATENILMAATRVGGDRQALHERIRVHSMETKMRGGDASGRGPANDLIDRLRADPAFQGVDLADILDSERYVGRAPAQVEAFIQTHIEPIRRRFAHLPCAATDLNI